MVSLELVAPPGVPPRGRRRRAPQTREAILEAVRELLKSRRLDDLQVNEIVEHAGISRQTFYVHFDTKYAVVAALIEAMGDGILNLWSPLFDGDGPIEKAQLVELGAGTIAAWRAQGPLWTATIEGWHTDGEIHDVWNEVLETFAARLLARVARHRGAEGLRPRDAMLTQALISGFERSLYLAVSIPHPVLGSSDDDLAVMLAELWSRALAN